MPTEIFTDNMQQPMYNNGLDVKYCVIKLMMHSKSFELCTAKD